MGRGRGGGEFAEATSHPLSREWVSEALGMSDRSMPGPPSLGEMRWRPARGWAYAKDAASRTSRPRRPAFRERRGISCPPRRDSCPRRGPNQSDAGGAERTHDREGGRDQPLSPASNRFQTNPAACIDMNEDHALSRDPECRTRRHIRGSRPDGPTRIRDGS